ncbi:peptide ABC transporter permease [Sphingorhabdus lutea]|uniref:Peptide ABC transporter permease n=1 Tax=Sphingorhabdus lutea TaxID=1913578 RepID=A0A1L3J8Y9_9SPHN|nr:ABC transporter permease subunit [Sphingorhabdus lutea]APG61602.1 peptide ABC transporter permease [Sphingorhabdus lutea]
MKISAYILAAILAFTLLTPLLSPWDNASIDWDNVRAGFFEHGHILGSDDLGRDRLARLAAGTAVTLMVAAAASIVALVIGVIWGGIAGWIGGKTDEIMMRIVDGLYALPFMFIVILLMVLFGRSILLVFIGIGAVEWLTMARIVRGQVLSLRSRPYILAAKAANISAPRILWRHILPNIAGIAFAYLMLTVPSVVMVESFLSFLGLGVQEPMTSLGILVNEAAEDMDMAPMALILSGGMLVTIIICLTLLGEGLRVKFLPDQGHDNG